MRKKKSEIIWQISSLFRQMFLLFFSFASSIYIQHSATENSLNHYWDNETIDSYAQEVEKFALVVINPGDEQTSYQALATLATSGSYLAKEIVTGYTFPSEVPYLMQSTNLPLPVVFCMQRGAVFTSFEMPLDDTYVIKQIETVFTGPKDLINSLEDMNKYLTNLDYTLICRSTNIDVAMEMIYDSIPYLGTCGLVIGSSALFEQLEAADSPLALFRRDDLVVIPILNTSESLVNNSAPYYSLLSDDDFADPEMIVVGLLNPDMVETTEINDAMYEIATKFPQMKVGIISDLQMNYANGMMDHIPQQYPDLVVMNYEKGIFYPTGSLENITIGPEWTQKTIEILEAVQDGKTQPMYLTEIPVAQQKDPYFVKVVGSEFENFISDKEKSTVMVFINGDAQDGVSEDISAVAAELHKNGTTGVKFAHFNAIRNAAKNLPRFIRMPHVELYVAGTGKSISMLDAINRDGILRFLSEHLPNLNIEAPPMDPDTGFALYDMYTRSLSQFGEEDQNMIREYIAKLKEMMPTIDEKEDHTKDL